MSALSFLESLWSNAEKVATAAEPALIAGEPAAVTLAPVVEALAPSTAPVINAISGAAAAVTALAPSAINDVKTITAAARQTSSDIGPALAGIEAAAMSLYHIFVHPVSGAVIMTPKTTTATIPAPAPGKALS